jgi:TRAP-type C4-dicarboxylate transport system substrate-binding protein
MLERDMTLRTTWRFVTSALAVAALLTIVTGRRAHAQEAIKIGTLAPKSSPWGQVYTTWEKAVKEKSGGRLELQFFFNGQQGDEAAMVAKVKSGALDGAAVSAVGLGKVYKPILALEMPGLFASWAKLDAARTALKADFEKGAKDAGFAILGWGDVGRVRMMSKGFAVRVAADLKGKKPFVWRDNPIQAVIYQVLGGVTPVPLNVPEVLPNLNTGAINALWSPSLLAEQLQWASKLDHVVDDAPVFSVGAIVLSAKRLDALPADLRQIVVDTGKVAAAALTKRIRNEDDAAYGRLKAKMTVVTLTAAEKATWAEAYKRVRAKLGQGTFTPELVKQLEDLGK